jgi:hypothetical protein
MVTAYQNGWCSTKCGKRLSWFDCTAWWRDVTCPECRKAIGYEGHMARIRPKRRRLRKVPA